MNPIQCPTTFKIKNQTSGREVIQILYMIGFLWCTQTQRVTLKDKELGLNELYLRTPSDQKLDLWLKSYSNFDRIGFYGGVTPRNLLSKTNCFRPQYKLYLTTTQDQKLYFWFSSSVIQIQYIISCFGGAPQESPPEIYSQRQISFRPQYKLYLTTT